jgi:hypothetical protein
MVAGELRCTCAAKAVKGGKNSTITQVILTITIDRGQDDIVQAPSGDSFGSVLWLMNIQGFGCLAGLDRAETASTGALVSHQLKVTTDSKSQ